MPSGHPERTLEGFDTWKRLIQQQINQIPASHAVDKQAVQGVHAGVKQAINAVSPEYQELMDQWSAVKDNLQNIASLGTNNRTAANNELARFMKAQKTPQGQQLIEQLADKDPLIPYMVAGATLHNAGATGVPGIIEKGTGFLYHFPNIGSHLLTGDWKGLLGASALAAGQGTVQSPRLMGQTAYGIGTMASSPVGKVTEAATEALPKFASPASPYAINVKRAEKETDPFAGYLDKPQGFASGGKVTNSKKQMLVKRLMDLAEKAKKEVSKNTEPLLNAPDEAIVKALHVANQAI